jgi:hypothetical protein
VIRRSKQWKISGGQSGEGNINTGATDMSTALYRQCGFCENPPNIARHRFYS